MKRLVIILAAALVAVAIYAVTAPAGPQAVSPRQFTALQKRVSALEKKAKVLTNTLKCLNQYAPITAYGDSQNGTEGYLYRTSSNTTAVTAAVDFTGQGDTADADVALVNKSCIGSARFGLSRSVALKQTNH